MTQRPVLDQRITADVDPVIALTRATPDLTKVGRDDEIAGRLRQQIVSGLHLGRLAPNARLPSTRVLAAEMGVAPRVITRAYHALVVDGLVELRPRSGFYVGGGGRGSRETLPDFARWVVDAFDQASNLDVPPVDLAERLSACISAGHLTAACVECNDDQLHGLACELALDYGFQTCTVLLSGAEDTAGRDALAGADLLVTTPFHSTEVRRIGRQLGKPCVVVSIRADLRRWMQDELGRGDVYVVATDERFAAKAQLMFADLGGRHCVRVRVVGRDDLSDVPPDAPAYVTRRARKLLGEHRLVSRAPRMPRLFARESRRELLSFIVRSNAATAPALPQRAR